MRKEDKIRQQQSQTPPERQSDQSQPQSGERVKGSASGDQMNRPPREPGKPYPLPD